MIKNIFFPKAPMHDGAMIIRDEKIFAAGCFLPLSNSKMDEDLGTRHHAALGMSEVSDAIIVVVSEETGNISVAMDGRLQRGLTPEALSQLLRTNLLLEEEKKRYGFEYQEKKEREKERRKRNGGRSLKNKFSRREVFVGKASFRIAETVKNFRILKRKEWLES